MLLTLEDYQDIDSIIDIQISESTLEQLDSHIMFFNEKTQGIDVVLMDEDKFVLEYYSFESIEIAEVFLEENFDAEILPLDEYDTSNVKQLIETNENIQDIKKKVQRAVKSLETNVRKLGTALGQEGKETKAMVTTFFGLLAKKLGSRSHNPTPSEVTSAIEQLKDVNRIAFLMTIWVLPLGTTTIITLHTFAKKYNINIFPSSMEFLNDSFNQESDYLSHLQIDLHECSDVEIENIVKSLN